MILHYPSPAPMRGGGHGHVFIVGDVAYKLFSRREGPGCTDQLTPFERQVAAYEILSRTPALAVHAPAFYGTVRVTSVLRDGVDIIDQYWPDYCYAMERLAVDPLEAKLRALRARAEWPRLKRIAQEFEGAGIGAMHDASALHWQSETPKFVDFETPETRYLNPPLPLTEQTFSMDAPAEYQAAGPMP